VFDLSDIRGRHAIVIGASLAGLLAGRVLAEHFDHVTLVDRDTLPEGPESRKGVPQGRHIHVLLARGSQLLEQSFPGLAEELAAAGATPIDWAADCRWFNFGGWKPRFTSGLTSCVGSRELLEWHIRRRVAGYSNLHWLSECDVTALLTDENRKRVTGVRIRPRPSSDHSVDGQLETTLPADLVVNASGRDSRAADWLRTLGYPAPGEERINSFLGYASCCYERPRHWQADWQALILSATPPQSSRGGVIVPLEGGRWLVTLAGAARDYPPTDEAGFLDFARSLPAPLLYQTIKEARRLTDIVGYRRTENLRRYYERLPRFLEGFMSLGDAVCAFNPVYGQGMTVAALGAQALDECLRVQRQQRPDGDLAGLAKRFHKKLGRIVALPWLLATGEDLRYATTEGGHLGLASRFLRPYLDRVLLSANQNPNGHRAFLQVVHLVKSPVVLFALGVLTPVVQQILIPKWRLVNRLDNSPLDRSNV
jgi:2-polyprenyl-6-methoxyphenol hydroxylase-like FAD-dependent oxidoreductase